MSVIDAEADPDVALDIPILIFRGGQLVQQWTMAEIHLKEETDDMDNRTAGQVKLDILNDRPELHLQGMEHGSSLVLCYGDERIIIPDDQTLLPTYSDRLFTDAKLAVVDLKTPVSTILEDHLQGWKSNP